MRTYVFKVALISALIAPTLRAQTPPVKGCEVTIEAENKLGNFEIQDLRVTEGPAAGNRGNTASPLVGAIRIAPNATGRLRFTLKSPCGVRRSIQVHATAKSLVNNEVVKMPGIMADDDWETPVARVRFEAPAGRGGG